MKKDESRGDLLKKKTYSTQKNSEYQGIEYDNYHYSLKEAFLVLLLISFIVIAISFLFYRSLYFTPLLFPIAIYMWKDLKKIKIQKRKRMLSDQFKDCLTSVSASLRAGYSAENAFRESLSDITLIYGKQSYMAIELELIRNGLSNKRNLEEILFNLGDRSGISDIREFAEVFRIAKRSGGSMTGIINDTVSIMNRKIEIDQEIQVQITSKKLESLIMNLIPFLIIAYLSFVSPGFFECLYHNLRGILIMTGCLVIYCIGFWLSKRIMDIEV